MTTTTTDLFENKINYRRHENWTLYGLMMHLREGSIDLDPPYQRGYVWDPPRREALIESLFWGLSLPAVYFRDVGKNQQKWLEVLDGKQRLNTIRCFVEGHLTYRGVKYSDLNDVSRRRFEQIGVPVIIVAEIDEATTLDLFRRLNYGGVVPGAEGLNYLPNWTTWEVGDLVLHDADAKRETMLMRVVGYTREGLCKTRYVDEYIRGRKVYKNHLKYLHDPRRFGIAEEALTLHKEAIRQ